MELNNKWILWSHELNNTNWEKNSYKKLYELNNLYDLKIINDFISKDLFNYNMIFMMKDGIFPTWEDQNNYNVNYQFNLP